MPSKKELQEQIIEVFAETNNPKEMIAITFESNKGLKKIAIIKDDKITYLEKGYFIWISNQPKIEGFKKK